jgi:hypothetical protein
MTGAEETERRPGDGSSRRMPGAYRNFLGSRRPSAIFAADRESPGPSAGGDVADGVSAASPPARSRRTGQGRAEQAV